MKTAAKPSAWLLIVLTVLSCFNCLRGQEVKVPPADTDFHYYIANVSRVNDARIEFDLLILNTNPDRVFELGSIQAGIFMNASIVGKGVITASLVPGTSTLTPSQVPGVITFNAKKSCIKIAPKAPPGFGNGSIISADPKNPSRLCRVQLTTSKSFLNGDPDFHFCLNGKPYPSKISKYDHETGMNVPLMINSYTCFTQADNEVFSGSATKTIRSEDMIQVFPNPNNGKFTLAIQTETAVIFEIQVRNELGTILYQEENLEVQGKVNHPIQIKNAPDGTYTLTLSRKGEIFSRKFLVKH